MTAAERPDELHGRHCIESVTGLQLVREDERDVPWVDYSSKDGRHGFEMKRVVPSKFMKFSAQVAKEPVFESAVLSKKWTVMVEAPTNDDWLGPLPDFIDPPPETFAFWTRNGFTVSTAAERRARFLAERRAELDSRVTVRGMARLLEPHLRILEDGCIASTRGARDVAVPQRRALMEINAITNGWTCMAHDPLPEADEVPGVDFAFSFGYARRGPEAFVQRVQNWIDAPDTNWTNVVQSTANGPWAVRHGVLLFDPSEPDFYTAEECPDAFLPSTPVRLADPIVLWCLFGRVVLRQDLDGTWHVFQVDLV